jgi:Cu/Ag efflux protein CusF
MLNYKLRTALQQAARTSAARAAAGFACAEVVEVNRDAGSVTLEHAGVVHLSLPPMTMVFDVQRPALLDSLRPGGKVWFKAIDAGGRFIVTGIEGFD